MRGESHGDSKKKREKRGGGGGTEGIDFLQEGATREVETGAGSLSFGGRGAIDAGEGGQQDFSGGPSWGGKWNA